MQVNNLRLGTSCLNSTSRGILLVLVVAYTAVLGGCITGEPLGAGPEQGNERQAPTADAVVTDSGVAVDSGADAGHRSCPNVCAGSELLENGEDGPEGCIYHSRTCSTVCRVEEGVAACVEPIDAGEMDSSVIESPDAGFLRATDAGCYTTYDATVVCEIPDAGEARIDASEARADAGACVPQSNYCGHDTVRNIWYVVEYDSSCTAYIADRCRASCTSVNGVAQCDVAPDAGVVTDAGFAPDAVALDATAPDAAPADATAPDAELDAGFAPDAEPVYPDATPVYPDATLAPDADAPDAGLSDTGVVLDSSAADSSTVADAGMSDAGAGNPDASVAADSGVGDTGVTDTGPSDAGGYIPDAAMPNPTTLAWDATNAELARFVPLNTRELRLWLVCDMRRPVIWGVYNTQRIQAWTATVTAHLEYTFQNVAPDDGCFANVQGVDEVGYDTFWAVEWRPEGPRLAVREFGRLTTTSPANISVAPNTVFGLNWQVVFTVPLPDAGVADGGVSPDAALDAGFAPDAMVQPDATSPDAASAPDAEAPDAGQSDTGVVLDASAADSSTVADAGRSDAGAGNPDASVAPPTQTATITWTATSTAIQAAERGATRQMRAWAAQDRHGMAILAWNIHATQELPNGAAGVSGLMSFRLADYRPGDTVVLNVQGVTAQGVDVSTGDPSVTTFWDPEYLGVRTNPRQVGRLTVSRPARVTVESNGADGLIYYIVFE